MGSAVSSSFESSSRVQPAKAALSALTLAVLATLVLLARLCFAGRRGAMPPPAQPAAQEAAKAPDKLVIDADELVYDKDKNTVSAIGSVQLFYQGRVLQADRVVYNRATKRVYAEGHAKMTDEHGDVVYGSRFELSDNFRDGFIDSVQAADLRQDALHVAARRADERRRDRAEQGRLHGLRAL